MKTIIQIIVYSFFVSGCARFASYSENNNYDHEPGIIYTKLKIWKIDSLNSFYLIYGSQGKSLFKIVSHKVYSFGGNEIHLKGKYKLRLQSIWQNKIMINGVNVSPATLQLVNCLTFDSTTSICIERDSINDLYYAYNIKGLKLNK